MKQCKTTEQLKIEFLGFKLDCSNPGCKTIIIWAAFLLFLFAMVFLFRDGILGVMTVVGAKNIYSALRTKVQLFSGH